MRDQRILITIPWFTPAFKAGGPVQSILQLVSQHQQGLQYFIYCSDADLNGVPLKGIEKNKWIRFNSNTSVWYAADNVSSAFTQQCEKLNPDVLFIIGLYSRHFNIMPLLFGKAKQKILSVRGMLHPAALQQKQLKKKLFLSLLKLSGKTNKVLFHATDEQERKSIQSVFGKSAKIAVASNFPALNTPAAPLPKNVGDLSLISIALISPMKNHLLIIDALLRCTGNIIWNIYGPVKDMMYWQHCLDAIKLLPKNITVKFYGEIPSAETAAALAANHVFILPSKSENFGHVFTESLSAGKPVITSQNTPWNDLEKNYAGINADETAAATAKAIDRFVVMDETEYRTYCHGAAEYISGRINLDHIHEDYKRMFNSNDAS